MEGFGASQQSRRATEDFVSKTLAAIPSDFGKLWYVSSLKDHRTNRYLHEGLAYVYSDAAVQEALSHCHEELFSKILETPLEEQEAEWRRYPALATDPEGTLESGGALGESLRKMAPEGLPAYLVDLFVSNATVMRAATTQETVISGPGA